jgi:hypothetical protein
MSTLDESETEEGLMRRAYSMGMKLKNSGLDQELIYVRLEKEGIPESLAREVANNMAIETKKEIIRDEKPKYYIALVSIGLGLLAAIISTIILPGRIMLPLGLIIGGVVYALVAKEKMR